MAKLENKTKENPKLEQNKLSDGRISLYLEYYLGREEKPVLDENGNQVYYDSGKMQGKPKFAVKHNRRKENLSLYLIDKPRTPAERQQNKETLELATKIRAEREQEFKESMLGYRLKKDRTVNFLDYFQAYINSYTKKDIRMVQIALSRFKDFLNCLLYTSYTCQGWLFTDIRAYINPVFHIVRKHKTFFRQKSRFLLLFGNTCSKHATLPLGY